MSRECKTCGVENGRSPQAEYCSPRCWQKSLREPLDEEERGADCRKFLRVFEVRIERMREQTKPINDDEEPSIIWAIINWHKANPEMQLKSKDEQWKAWLQWENHCRTHRDFASWQRLEDFTPTASVPCLHPGVVAPGGALAPLMAEEKPNA